MQFKRQIYLIPLYLLCAMLTCRAAETAASQDRFETRIRPLLAKHCYACHTQARLGGLELDSRESLLKGGKTGPAVIPENPDKSLLIQAIRYTHPSLKMPPSGRLTDAEIQEMTDWVQDGAVWTASPPTLAASSKQGFTITPEQRAFWSFQPVRKPTPPAVKDASWARGSIDRFVLAKLEQRELKPVHEVDRRIWIRRTTFDLTGLPPTPEEVSRFLADPGENAYEVVVDRLLASPRYGERQARHWLDIARYSDDVLDTQLGFVPSFYLYRDWVIRSFNEDMPYDLFIKAQLAGDLLPGQDTQKLLPALTVFVNTSSSEFADDDRVDVATRGFLGLTVACAQCHDHKYDPIPTKDFYALFGIFHNTQYREVPLSDAATVEDFRKHQQGVTEQEKEIRQFLAAERQQIADILAGRTREYLVSAWNILGPAKQSVTDAVRLNHHLDTEVLERWVRYLKMPGKQHPFLRRWQELLASGKAEAEIRQESRSFQDLVVQVLRDKKAVDEYNTVLSFGAKLNRELNNVQGRTMPRDRYMLWQELAAEGNPRTPDSSPEAREDGVLCFSGDTVLRFLPPEWGKHLAEMRARLTELKAAMPPPYPYLSTIEESANPSNLHVFIRGNPKNPGEEAPRGFLTVLKELAPEPVTHGSGRLQLAEAIANPRNPLTSRVMVNRIWEQHFGYGLVRTPSNFGQTGDRPVHPELLDYLAGRFMEQSWSVKKLHREIVLSSTYRLSTEFSQANAATDPDNRLHWRYARRRLDAEALRDSLLFVAGSLEEKIGGQATQLKDPANRRRTIYGAISRDALDPMLTLFDFPNPNATSEQRLPTTVPLQRLFLLNSELMLKQGEALAARLNREDLQKSSERVARAYDLLFQRRPSQTELHAALSYVSTGETDAWARYAQVLLVSNEFLYAY